MFPERESLSSDSSGQSLRISREGLARTAMGALYAAHDNVLNTCPFSPAPEPLEPSSYHFHSSIPTDNFTVKK